MTDTLDDKKSITLTFREWLGIYNNIDDTSKLTDVLNITVKMETDEIDKYIPYQLRDCDLYCIDLGCSPELRNIDYFEDVPVIKIHNCFESSNLYDQFVQESINGKTRIVYHDYECGYNRTPYYNNRSIEQYLKRIEKSTVSIDDDCVKSKVLL